QVFGSGEETAITVADKDLHGAIVGERDREIGVAVTVEVAGCKSARPRTDDERRRRDQIAQDGHGTTAEVGGDELGRLDTVEVGDEQIARHAPGRVERGRRERATAASKQHGDRVIGGYGGGEIE